jgi:tricorn protease
MPSLRPASRNRRAVSFVALLLAPGAFARNADTAETLLLQQPTISKDHVVFVYARDLWAAPRAGGVARRLTSDDGAESSPKLSPDGKWVAFTGQYEGNSDVYVMPVAGGVPRRLTWHPGSDRVCDWHPDSMRVAFASGREASSPGDRLYLVGIDGGPEQAMPVPKVSHVSFAGSGSQIAYTAIQDAFRTWKRHRGGTMCPVWILDLVTLEIEEIPHERASDTFPCFVGDNVYFASDRDLHMNVWKYSRSTQQLAQVTRFTDFDVRNMDTDGATVVFEQAGRLHLLDSKSDAITTLHITVPNDGMSALPRWEDARGSVRNAAIAPNGKRAVFEARGEIVTLPKEHGDVRNLTQSPGAHERNPTWSPDGKTIAYFSDASGEYELMLRDHLGREAPRSVKIGGGAGFYRNPTWSPDGKKLAFLDKGGRLAYLTVDDLAIHEIARLSGSLGEVGSDYVWSPDSQWIAYTAPNPKTLYTRVMLWEEATRHSTPLTDAFADCASPAFSRDQKHLFFAASIESGKNQFGLNMNAGAYRTGESELYVAVLQADGKNPLFPKSDEGVPSADDKKSRRGETEGKEGEDGKDKKDEAAAETKAEAPPADGDKKDADAKPAAKKKDLPKIDLAGIEQRILALPLPSANYGDLASTEKALLFLEAGRRGGGGGFGGGGGGPELKKFDFDSKKAESLLAGVSSFSVSADGESLLVRTSGGWQITNSSGKDAKSLAIDSVKLRVEPALEWPQTLREAWRIQRDYFYDPNMHGIDWPAMWTRWSAFLPHVRHREDLNLLIGEMIGELSCGHQYVSGGETPSGAEGVSVGLLGCDVVVANGLWQIKTIYRGQNWNPQLRSPLAEPGVVANPGDYIVKVNGVPLTASDNFFRAFENTANQQVELELSANAEGSGARTVKVVPIGSESSLRRMAWVEGNRKRVTELSDGRLAYVYMPDTGNSGEAAFDRDFYSQLDKDGLILDERYNGGGKVADYVIDILSRDVRCYWMNREAWLGRTPFAMIDGPKVMIVNYRAGSGGDWMPWAFQRAKLGPLVGTRTWGGLVGISGYPPLMDGGSVTAASFGVMDENGEWAVENEGVTPDHLVVEYPKDLEAGRDPQLEKAVELALADLAAREKKPLPTYKPPKKR